MDSQLNLELLSPSVEVARLKRVLVERDLEIAELSFRLEMYEMKLLEAAHCAGGVC